MYKLILRYRSYDIVIEFFADLHDNSEESCLNKLFEDIAEESVELCIVGNLLVGSALVGESERLRICDTALALELEADVTAELMLVVVKVD